MPYSSFKITFRDDDKEIKALYAYQTFINALIYIGLDRVSKLKIHRCKSRVVVIDSKESKWGYHVNEEKRYRISARIGNVYKRWYIEKVCEALDINVHVDL